MSFARARGGSRGVREQLGNLFALLRRAARFWAVPLVALVAGCVAAGVFLYVRQPTYRSEMVVLYSQGSPRGVTAPANELRSVTARLKELLFTRATLERVVTEFDLYPEARHARGITDGVDELERHIAFRSPGGDTFGIAFEGTSPIQAKLVTTRLTERVMAADSALRNAHARLARDFLVAEKEKAEIRLLGTERELASFMAEHPRFALDATSFAAGAAIRASVEPSAAARAGTRAPTPWAPSTAASTGPVEQGVVVLETQWTSLTRGVTESRQHQNHVEAQLFDADIVASSESGGHGLQMTVIDPAFLPLRAVPPGRPTIAALFVGLALVLGLFGAVLCAALDDRIWGARDLAAFSVVLAEIPTPSSRGS
ncbi:MAG TPA: hypothetical protein VFZ53_20920 [Polyangiaceae bacterium]